MNSYLLNHFFTPPLRKSSVFDGLLVNMVKKRLSSCVVKLPSFLTRWSATLAPCLLAFILFSCFFVPRVSLSGIFGFYRSDLRLDDLLLVLLAVLFVFRKGWGMGNGTVERAWIFFLLAAGISIFNGFFKATIDKPLVSFLYWLKWFQYFIFFALASRVACSPRHRSSLLLVFFFLGIAVAAFGYYEHFFPMGKAIYPNYYRLYERPPFRGDANHVGGFFCVWIGFFTGYFMNVKSKGKRNILFWGLIAVLFPFIWTYSRKSYFALGGSFLLPFFLSGSKRRFIFLCSVFLLLGLLLPTRLSERVNDIWEAFSEPDPFHSSWTADTEVWRKSLWNFKEFMAFGSGLGSRHRLFYESQYVLVVSETGILGSLAFLYLLFTAGRGVWRSGKAFYSDKAAVTGWLTGSVALMIHSFSCVSLTVTKIAIPFWFLTALVLSGLKTEEDAVA